MTIIHLLGKKGQKACQERKGNTNQFHSKKKGVRPQICTHMQPAADLAGLILPLIRSLAIIILTWTYCMLAPASPSNETSLQSQMDYITDLVDGSKKQPVASL